jgi:hypothetical protein
VNEGNLRAILLSIDSSTHTCTSIYSWKLLGNIQVASFGYLANSNKQSLQKGLALHLLAFYMYKVCQTMSPTLFLWKEAENEGYLVCSPRSVLGNVAKIEIWVSTVPGVP